jgi:hypothetical protein
VPLVGLAVRSCFDILGNAVYVTGDRERHIISTRSRTAVTLREEGGLKCLPVFSSGP